MTEQRLKLFALAIIGLAVVKTSFAISDLDKSVDESGYIEDANISVKQLIKKYGYHGETHEVITEDGYILEMHRITGPNSNPSPEGKKPILLMHQVLSSSADWVLTGPDKAFGYILADQGYDVWMGNARGNKYSRKHIKYSTDDKEYWQFSWHEIGVNDLPAMIDCILGETKKQQLIYAGHSQGTTVFWVMASERPEYQDKVKAMFALAPVAYVTHTKSPFFHVAAKFSKNIDKIASLLGQYEFDPTSDFVKKITIAFCKDESWSQLFCKNIMFLITGPVSDQFNMTMLPLVVGHLPAGGSVKQIIHYLQSIKAGRFQQYDHGIIGNMKKYQKLRPPVYDLSKIKVPVALHYGENDWLAVPKDVDRLYKELGNPIGKFKVPYEKFTHVDFLWAIDVKQLLYDKILGLMERYEN